LVKFFKKVGIDKLK